MSSFRSAYIGSKILLFLFGIPMLIWGIIVIILKFAIGRDYLVTISIGVIGFILVSAGIASVLALRLNRAKILGALRSYERVSLEQLSSELKFSKNKTKKAIIHLRAEGKLKASFEPVTGDVLVLEVDGELPMAVVPMSSSGLIEHEEKYKDKQIPKDLNYCSYCGSIVKPEDQFCNNCGTYLS
ncbi:MAG: zinc-ribbon domain-containing protein [Asgard group archaeon]|nr:zinc-ribbon domain-containing protein [Asgard group archaeon]